jgi:hypothetical protein
MKIAVISIIGSGYTQFLPAHLRVFGAGILTFYVRDETGGP